MDDIVERSITGCGSCYWPMTTAGTTAQACRMGEPKRGYNHQLTFAPLNQCHRCRHAGREGKVPPIPGGVEVGGKGERTRDGLSLSGIKLGFQIDPTYSSRTPSTLVTKVLTTSASSRRTISAADGEPITRCAPAPDGLAVALAKSSIMLGSKNKDPGGEGLPARSGCALIRAGMLALTKQRPDVKLAAQSASAALLDSLISHGYDQPLVNWTLAKCRTAYRDE
jgi:hypothetical protein